MKKLLLILPLALILFFMVGCQDKEAMAEPEDGDTLPGFIFSEPASNTDGKIKIFVMYDMEGLSGIDDWKMTDFQYSEQFRKGQEYLTAEINAVIEGIFDAGGVDVVYVFDGHGSGSPAPDIILEKLDSRATYVDTAKIPEEKSRWNYDVYDGLAFVGMHSRTGGGGFMSHTGNPGIDVIYNGRSINESEIWALNAGVFDLPVIFVSGDDKLVEQLEPYYWIDCVTTKYSTSAYTANLRPLDEVYNELRVVAKKAVENMQNAKVLKLRTPIKAGLRTVPPSNLGILEGIPGIDFHDDTVTFEAKDYREARRGIGALWDVGYRYGYFQGLRETLRKQDNYKEIWDEFHYNRIIRWLDYESGRWKPQKK